MPVKLSRNAKSLVRGFGMSTKRATALANYSKGLRRGARRSTYPARLSGSRLNYTIAKQVNKAMNNVSENKVSPLSNFDEAAPAAIQPLALAYTKSFTIGTVPNAWSGTVGLSSLGGMVFPNGTGHQQRVGKYVYLQKTHFTMEIDMGIDLDYQVPTEFRVICFKARRGNNPSGITNAFANSLFISPAGNEFGHATGGINGSDLMLQPLNKKDWIIKSDRKFMLSNPATAAGSGVATSYSGKYPCMKRLTFNLPYYAKTEIDSVTDAPSDLDTNYVIAVYARSLAKDSFASKWEVTTRGTTSFKDN